MSDVESANIEAVDVYSRNLAQWNIEVKDYEIGGERVDFQDLLVVVSEDRARVIEEEIEPMSVRMDVRNKRLDQLGDALAIISDLEAQWTDSDKYNDPKDSTIAVGDSAKKGLAIIGCPENDGSEYYNSNNTLHLPNKSRADYYQQMLKSKIDSLNNAANDDMTRLQSLVDRRDEAYETATSLMQSVGDTRSNTIKNMC